VRALAPAAVGIDSHCGVDLVDTLELALARHLCWANLELLPQPKCDHFGMVRVSRWPKTAPTLPPIRLVAIRIPLYLPCKSSLLQIEAPGFEASVCAFHLDGDRVGIAMYSRSYAKTQCDRHSINTCFKSSILFPFCSQHSCTSFRRFMAFPTDDDRLADFQTAVPSCTIHWDCGTLSPKLPCVDFTWLLSSAIEAQS
jgi:hypothetical protein